MEDNITKDRGKKWSEKSLIYFITVPLCILCAQTNSKGESGEIMSIYRG